jgi:hypothetical protein
MCAKNVQNRIGKGKKKVILLFNNLLLSVKNAFRLCTNLRIPHK